MNVLVTGGAGFIGSNLCRELLASDDVDRVVALDDLSTGSEENLAGLDVDLRVGSVLDDDMRNGCVADVDAVVHLAARPSVPRSIADPVTSHTVNVDGTFALLESIRAAGGRHIVFASSSSVYGANKELPKRVDMVARPLSPYAVTKLAGESYVLAYRNCFDIPALAVRFFNVYGPHQAAGAAYAPVIPAFISAALDGRALPVHGDGLQSRDFTYVGSVAATLTAAVTRQVSLPVPLNLAFGVRYTLMDVIEMLGDISGREVAVEHLDPRAGDVRHSQADSSQMAEFFADVTPVDLRDGLTRTYEWWATQGTPSPA